MEEDKPKKRGRPKQFRPTAILPKGAQEGFERFRIKPQRDPNKKKKYKKVPQLTYIYEGYDLLENLGIVRKYIMKRYGINQVWLDLLLFLFAEQRQIFSPADYREFPKYNSKATFRYMLSNGEIECFSKGKNRNLSLYRLSRKNRKIVMNFYRYLFGEKKIPISNDPVSFHNATPLEKTSMQIIQKLNGMPVSENKKRFFE